MKKIILLLLGLAVFAGCKKDDSNTPAVSKSTLTGKWYATKMRWIRYTNSGTIDSVETLARNEDNTLQLNSN